MDYQATLYSPIYAIQGVPAVLTLATGEVVDGLTALDKTAGVEIADAKAEVATIKPAAVLRIPELVEKGVAVAETPKGSIALNGYEWSIVSYRFRPSPNGENDGEVYLVLTGKTAVSP